MCDPTPVSHDAEMINIHMYPKYQFSAHCGENYSIILSVHYGGRTESVNEMTDLGHSPSKELKNRNSGVLSPDARSAEVQASYLC